MNPKNEKDPLELPIEYYDPFKLDHLGNRGIITQINISHFTYRYRSRSIWPKMQDRLLNVNGYPIKICAFDILGLVQSIKDENGTIINYNGMDAEAMWILLEASNFSRVYVSPPEGEMFGGRLPNGSSSGQLWVMENQLADIAVNTRMIQDYGSNMANFLQSTGDIRFNFLTPERGYAKRIAFLNILDRNTYLFISIAYLSVFGVWVYMNKIRSSMEKRSKFWRMDFIKDALVIFGTSALVSQPWPKNTQERILLSSMVLLSLVIGCSYQGTMYKILATQQASLNYETLESLEQSDLELLITLSFKPNSYIRLGNNIYDKILKKATFVTDVKSSIKRVMEKKDAAMMIQESSLDMYQSMVFNTQTGENIIHKVGQPFKIGSGGFMSHKMCPYMHRLNDVLLHMIAGGLILQKKRELHKLIYLNLLKRPRIDYGLTMFNMSELSIIFKSLYLGLALSSCVFILEIIIHGFINHKTSSKITMTKFRYKYSNKKHNKVLLIKR